MHIVRYLLLSALLTMASAVAARTIEMKVHGLVCAFCAQGIEKRLRDFAATDEVFVSLEQGLVAVALKEGEEIADAELRQALTDAGYTVVTVNRSDETLAALRRRVAED